MGIFMKYEGMQGNATEENHPGPDWISCNSLSFSAFRDAQAKMGQGGSRQGKPVEIGDFTFTKEMDPASPNLYLGSLFSKAKKVTIHITRGGEGATNCLELELGQCCVTNYSISSDGNTHSEVVSINALELGMKYTPINPDRSPGTPIPMSFSVPTGEVK
jgi:type VI protein secretion system component Hcp